MNSIIVRVPGYSDVRSEYNSTTLAGTYFLGKLDGNIFTATTGVGSCRDGFLNAVHSNFAAGARELEFILITATDPTTQVQRGVPLVRDRYLAFVGKPEVQKIIYTLGTANNVPVWAIHIRFPVEYYLDPVIFWIITHEFREKLCDGLSKVGGNEFYNSYLYAIFKSKINTLPYKHFSHKYEGLGVIGYNSPYHVYMITSYIHTMSLQVHAILRGIKIDKDRFGATARNFKSFVDHLIKVHPDLRNISFYEGWSISSISEFLGHFVDGSIPNHDSSRERR